MEAESESGYGGDAGGDGDVGGETVGAEGPDGESRQGTQVQPGRYWDGLTRSEQFLCTHRLQVEHKNETPLHVTGQEQTEQGWAVAVEGPGLGWMPPMMRSSLSVKASGGEVGEVRCHPAGG